MTKTLALGAASATAFARSRTMEALVLNRSAINQHCGSFAGWMDGTVSGHARLSRHTGGYLGTCESLLQAICVGLVAGDNALGIYMADVSRDTFSQLAMGYQYLL